MGQSLDEATDAGLDFLIEFDDEQIRRELPTSANISSEIQVINLCTYSSYSTSWWDTTNILGFSTGLYFADI